MKNWKLVEALVAVIVIHYHHIIKFTKQINYN